VGGPGGHDASSRHRVGRAAAARSPHIARLTRSAVQWVLPD
jgi:hypothetical protein